MANWASTSYRIEGKQEDLKTLNELINEFMDGKRPVMEDNASKDWEGNVAWNWERTPKGIISVDSSRLVNWRMMS